MKCEARETKYKGRTKKKETLNDVMKRSNWNISSR